MLRTTLIILLLTSCVDLLVQTNYARFVNPDKMGEKQVIDTGDGGSEEIIYLGAIHGKGGQIIYQIFSVFGLFRKQLLNMDNQK